MHDSIGLKHTAVNPALNFCAAPHAAVVEVVVLAAVTAAAILVLTLLPNHEHRDRNVCQDVNEATENRNREFYGERQRPSAIRAAPQNRIQIATGRRLSMHYNNN